MERAYRFWRGFLFFLTCVWAQPRRFHAERVPQEGAAVLVSNHVAMFDMALLASLSRRFQRMVCKKELMRFWLTRAIVRAVGAIPVDREHADIDALKAMLRSLKAGEMLMMFPEGTRNRHRDSVTLQPLHEGAAMLALRSGAPVVPVWISGHYTPFGKLRVHVGEPVNLDAFRGQRKPDLTQATQAIAEAMVALSGQVNTLNDC